MDKIEKFEISYKDKNHPSCKIFDLVIDGLTAFLGEPPNITFLVDFAPNEGEIYFWDKNLWEDGCIGNRLILKELGLKIWGQEPPIIECLRYIEQQISILPQVEKFKEKLDQGILESWEKDKEIFGAQKDVDNQEEME